MHLLPSKSHYLRSSFFPYKLKFSNLYLSALNFTFSPTHSLSHFLFLPLPFFSSLFLPLSISLSFSFCLSLSIYLSIYPSLSPSIFLYFNPSPSHMFYLSVSVSLFLSISLFLLLHFIRTIEGSGRIS